MECASGAAAPLIARLERVHAGFSRKPVFTDLSLDLRAGEHLALVGANGSGKSTLLSLLHGDLRPAPDLPDRARPGKIYWYFEGIEDASPLAAREYARLVSPAQQRRLVRLGAAITGREIILSGLDNAMMLYGAPAAEHEERASDLAEAAGAARLLSVPAPAMSRGQLRLCLIVRALASRPRLLLLDEPFDGLDREARGCVMRGLEFAAGRCTVLAGAHRREDVPSFMREMLLLRDGLVIRRAMRAAAPACPEDARPSVARSPSRGAPPAVSGDTPSSRGRDRPQPTRRSRTARDSAPSSRGRDRPPLLRLEHVNVFMEGRRVLRDICWTVLSGERWLLTGPNGSGKSTLLRLLYGDEQAALGSVVSWNGGKRPRLEELRRSVGFVSDRLQDMYAYDLSAGDTVISGLRGSIGLYGESGRDERELAFRRLERMGVPRSADALLSSLSTGTARRVMLARALAGSPSVLLLDEPCSGLDPEGRELFFDTLSELAQRGVSLVCVSHHNDRADLFTHELRLEEGCVRYAGPTLS
jgi:molybdate transport system ATP-binding protein